MTGSDAANRSREADRRDEGTTLPALKERAGVVNALVDGAQTLLVGNPRFDGDVPGTFALYPSYTHQKPSRYRDRYERYYREATTKPESGVPLRAVAAVVDEYAVEASALPRLAHHYVYTPDGLRDKYDLTDGVRVVLLRVERLAEPRLVADRPAYRGCRSWIRLDGVGAVTSTPVLDDAAFAERRAAVEAVLR